MSSMKLEQIVENLFIIIPLLKRKLPKSGSFIDKPALNPSHHQIMFMLDDLGGQSISDIVKTLGIAKTNITPLVDKLVSEGFVFRQSNTYDRRFININLTSKGKEYLEQVKMQLAADLKNKLAPLGVSDLDTLMISLGNVKDILSKL